MTEIIPPDMDAHFKALIDHPVSSRRAERDARELRVINMHSRPAHVESLIAAQSAEPVRHRRPSRWERVTGSPWFLPIMFVMIPVLVWALGSLLVRWVEFMQGSGL